MFLEFPEEVERLTTTLTAALAIELLLCAWVLTESSLLSALVHTKGFLAHTVWPWALHWLLRW